MTEAVSIADALRPPESLVLAAWAALVHGDNEQVEALPERPRPEDFYAPVAQQFRADPRRTGDESLDYLRSLVREDETWLDLGAGGGRYALAIALRCRRLYAVEPSAGMRQVLESSMREHGIKNIDIFDERWPGPSACPIADAGLISQVAYDIADIGPFLDQFEAHVARLCVAMLFERAPVADFAPLWEPVHGEPRVLLPGLREFVTLLFARGTLPEVRLCETRRPVFESLDDLHRAARRPLWVLEGTRQDERLRGAVRGMAVQVEGGYALSASPRVLGVISWRAPGPPRRTPGGRPPASQSA